MSEVTSLVAESTTTSSDDFTSSLENPLIFGDFREMTKMLDNYLRIFDGDEKEHKDLFRTYEELISGDPICKKAKREDGTVVEIKPAKMFDGD